LKPAISPTLVSSAAKSACFSRLLIPNPPEGSA
jgi:hypothetical protein